MRGRLLYLRWLALVALVLVASILGIGAQITTEPIVMLPGDPPQGIYVATVNGLCVSEDWGQTFTRYDPGNSNVTAVYVDGTDWYIGTWNGLCISNETSGVRTFQLLAPDPNDDETLHIRDVVVDDGTIYAATLGGLCISSDGGATFTTLTASHELGTTRTYDVRVGNGMLFVGTHGGLSISDDGGATIVTYTKADGLAADEVNGLHYDTDRDILYVATRPGGLSIAYDVSCTFPNLAFVNRAAIGSGMNSAIAVAAQGSRIVVGTYSSLNISRDCGATFTYPSLGLTSAAAVLGVAVHDRHIYAATEGGLRFSNDNGVSFDVLTTDCGLDSCTCRFVFLVR